MPRQKSWKIVGKVGLGCTVLFLVAGGSAFPAEHEDGDWEILFDGKSTAAWRAIGTEDFPTEGWVVEEGCLKLLPDSPGSRDLISLHQYTDFELRFDWKLSEGGNSGVKYGVREETPASTELMLRKWGLVVGTSSLVVAVVLVCIAFRVRNRLIVVALVAAIGLSLLSYHAVLSGTSRSGKAVGLEFQLYDDQDVKVPDKNASSGALYDLIAPTQNVVFPPGKFNSGRILVNGLNVEHWINGTKVLDYRLESEFLRERIAKSKFRRTPGFAVKSPGHISLQNHRDEVWFRDIRIRPISLENPVDSTSE